MGKEHKIDINFVSRNWLLLCRLSCMGFTPRQAKLLTKKIELGEVKFRELR